MQKGLKFVLMLVAVSLITFQSAAVTLFWDGGVQDIAIEGDGVSSGGAGIWNTSLKNWDQGSGLAHINWNNTASYAAVLDGIPGLIRLGESINVDHIEVNVDGYVFDLGNNNMTVKTLANLGSFTKTGSGILELQGDSTFYTGKLTVNDGMLKLNNGALLNGGTGITIKGGGGTVGGTGYPFKGVTRGGTFYLLDDSGPAGGSPLGMQTITLENGTILWKSGAGADTLNLETVSLASGFNSLSVAPASNPDVLKIKNLFRNPGAALEFRAAYHRLGTGEAQIQIEQINGVDIANDNGIIGGWACAAANDGAGEYAGTAKNFAAWDPSATIGGSVGSIVSATPDKNTGAGDSLSSALPSENWLVSGGHTINSDVTVNSLIIENNNLHLNDGATLTIASGGLILRGSSFYLEPGTGHLTSGCNDLYVYEGGVGTDTAIYAEIKDGAAGAVTLHKNGPGVLKLGKAGWGTGVRSVHTGGTVVNQGILSLGLGGEEGCIRGAVTVNAGGMLRLDAGDATGWGGGATALTEINLNGGNLHVNTAQAYYGGNQTLGSAVINMCGGSITGLSNGNIDFFGGGSALNTLASTKTSTISGVPISPLRQGNTTFTVADGSVAIDLQIDAVIRNSPSGDGQNGILSKEGAGTMLLNAENTFSANKLDVKDGTLLVGSSGSLGAGVPVTVSGSGTLGGEGTILGAVTCTSGGTLTAGGIGTIGTLNLANSGNNALTLNNTTVSCDLSIVGGLPLNDCIDVAGTLVLTGENIMVINMPAGGAQGGTYTLMTYSAKTGSGTLTLATDIEGAEFAVNETSVILTIPAFVWKGNIDNNWDQSTANWLYGSDVVPTAYSNGVDVIVDDSGAAAASINIVSNVAPKSVMVNSTYDYTIGGAEITGSATLAKAGSGILTLSSTNTFTGDITIDGGVLELTESAKLYNASHNNAAVLTVNAGGTWRLPDYSYGGIGKHSNYPKRRVLNGGTIEVTGTTHASGQNFTVNPTGGTFRYSPAASGTLTLEGNDNSNIQLDGPLTFAAEGEVVVSEVMQGSGSLRKSGNGTLTLSGANTFSGNVINKAGVIKMNNKAAFGAVDASVTKVTVEAGAAVDFNGIPDVPNGYTIAGSGPDASGALVNTGNEIRTSQMQASNITLSDTAAIGGTGNWALLTSGYNGTTLDLAGYTLTKVGVNTIRLCNTTISAGTIQVTAGTLGTVHRGCVGNNTALIIDDTAGVGFALDANLEIGSLSGGGVNGGNIAINSAELYVGALNTTTTYGGAISGAGSFVKGGTGILTLSGNNSYSGTTTVNAGTLLVNGNHTGAGAYTVGENGTLGGSGTVAGAVTLQGKLAPGLTDAGGQLTVGNLTLNEGAEILIDSEDDAVVVEGDLTFNNNAINVSGINSFTNKPKYVLFSYTGTLSGMPQFVGYDGGWNLIHDSNTKTIYIINKVGTLIIVR